MSALRSTLIGRVPFAAAIVLTTLVVAERADACSCGGPPGGGLFPACQEAWQIPTIFSGRVMEIVSTEQVIELKTSPGVKEQAIAVGPRRVRVRVTEVFRGSALVTTLLTQFVEGALFIPA
jgi:hypothetical protein